MIGFNVIDKWYLWSFLDSNVLNGLFVLCFKGFYILGKGILKDLGWWEVGFFFIKGSGVILIGKVGKENWWSLFLGNVILEKLIKGSWRCGNWFFENILLLYFLESFCEF